MSCAVSIDGYLDDASPDRLILSGPEDLDEVDALRAAADAILVGAGTIRADNPRLLVRDPARVAAREAAGKPAAPAAGHRDRHRRPGPGGPLLHRPGHPLVYAPRRPSPAAEKTIKDKAVVIDAGAELSLAAVLQDLHQNGPC